MQRMIMAEKQMFVSLSHQLHIAICLVRQQFLWHFILSANNLRTSIGTHTHTLSSSSLEPKTIERIVSSLSANSSKLNKFSCDIASLCLRYPFLWCLFCLLVYFCFRLKPLSLGALK